MFCVEHQLVEQRGSGGLLGIGCCQHCGSRNRGALPDDCGDTSEITEVFAGGKFGEHLLCCIDADGVACHFLPGDGCWITCRPGGRRVASLPGRIRVALVLGGMTASISSMPLSSFQALTALPYGVSSSARAEVSGPPGAGWIKKCL